MVVASGGSSQRYRGLAGLWKRTENKGIAAVGQESERAGDAAGVAEFVSMLVRAQSLRTSFSPPCLVLLLLLVRRQKRRHKTSLH